MSFLPPNSMGIVCGSFNAYANGVGCGREAQCIRLFHLRRLKQPPGSDVSYAKAFHQENQPRGTNPPASRFSYGLGVEQLRGQS